MRATEQRLRAVIRSILINEAAQASNAVARSDVQVDSNLYGFGVALLGSFHAGRPSPLLDQLLNLFGVSRKDNKSVEPLINGTSVSFIMEYKDDMWRVSTRIRPVRGMEIGRAHV